MYVCIYLYFYIHFPFDHNIIYFVILAHFVAVFNVLKVNDINLHQQLKFYFKLINNILPDHFYDFNLALNSEIHDYNTRGETN